MTHDEFARVYPELADAITGIACKLAGADTMLVDDLVQIARITLLDEIELANADTNFSAYARNAVKNRMVDFLRKLKLDRTDSLDQYMGIGGDVTRDGGVPRLIFQKPGFGPRVPGMNRWSWNESEAHPDEELELDHDEDA